MPLATSFPSFFVPQEKRGNQPSRCIPFQRAPPWPSDSNRIFPPLPPSPLGIWWGGTNWKQRNLFELHSKREILEMWMYEYGGSLALAYWLFVVLGLSFCQVAVGGKRFCCFHLEAWNWEHFWKLLLFLPGGFGGREFVIDIAGMVPSWLIRSFLGAGLIGKIQFKTKSSLHWKF